MMKYLKYILFLCLILPLEGGDMKTFADDLVNDAEFMCHADEVKKNEMYIVAPQLPYWSDAELAEMNGAVQLLSLSRLQRFRISEYLFSLKDWNEKLAQHEDVLSLHREKLYNATACYCCSPACEYYIFTLRHILI